MKKISILIMSLYVITSCKESNKDILSKTAEKLQSIQTVEYLSTMESSVDEVVNKTNINTIYFNFNNDSLKYHFNDNRGELVYNGNKTYQSNNENKVVLEDDSPDIYNPLFLTIYPLRKLLPEIIKDPDISISRQKDSVLDNENHYVFKLLFKEKIINWNCEIERTLSSDFEYTLFINQSDYFPKKIIAPNGENGTISRTFDRIKLEVNRNQSLWEGKNFPDDFPTFKSQEYYTSLKNKLHSYVGKKVEGWQLPDLEKDSLVRPRELTGNVILFEFWFENCGGCIAATPQLNQINDKYKKDSFRMYGVDFLNAPKEILKMYVEKTNIQYPTLYNGKSIATKYGIRSAPSFIIVDKKGTIIYAKAGFNQDEIMQVIEQNI